MMGFKFIKLHWPKFLSIFLFIILLGAYVNIFAIGSPYAPGATLDPACAPNDPNCTVFITGYTETDPITGAVNGLVKSNGAGVIGAVVSGTDIKTINGSSLLGSGDITVGGGSSPITVINSSNLFSTGLTGTGSGVTTTTKSIFFGVNAGSNATNAYSSNFFGENAGIGATNAYYSNFIGAFAGKDASAASYSNFIGNNAGYNATNAHDSNFFGYGAGLSATNVSNSNFIGRYAGWGATNSRDSNFIGSNTGQGATSVLNSNFIGSEAGYNAATASNSIFIGNKAGSGDTVNNTYDFSTKQWSILLGYNTNTGGYKNSVLIGGSSNSSPISNTKANQFMLAPTLTAMRLRGIDYTLPSYQGGNGTMLINDGNGKLDWGVQSPAGLNTEIQFNNNGVFGSSSGLTWNEPIVFSIGPDVNFIRLDSTPSIDIISPSVHIARGSTKSIYNEVNESFYDNNTNIAPTGTEWNADGWGDLSDVSTRTYDTFYNALGQNVGNNIFGAELVMHDIVADKYYKFYFTSWSSADVGGTGGFAYTRNLITLPNLATGNMLNASADILISGSNHYLNFGTDSGNLGYGLRDNAGNLEYKNSGGSWLGLGGGGGGSSPITIVNLTSLFSTGLTGSGSGVTGVSNSNFFGENAGLNATNAHNSNFFGSGAGSGATSALSSNFFGIDSGSGATSAYNSTFFGFQSGKNSVSANDSNFFGQSAGQSALNASYSNFFGHNAGANSTNATNSNFLGYRAGEGATNAANSIFIGFMTGYQDTADNTAAYDDAVTFANTSILFGHKTSTGGYSNSIAIGAYATNTATNQFMVGSTTRPINTTRFQGTSTECTITTGTGIACSSDINLKKNIKTLDEIEFALQTIPEIKDKTTLEKINLLTPVKYNWKEEGDSDPTHIGFIAQELEQVFGELVFTDPITGLKSVNYANITPYLVKGIQELDLKVRDFSSLDTTLNTSLGSLIKEFLSNATNNIDLVFFGEVHTKKLCLDDLCITKDELKQILEHSNASTINNSNQEIQENNETKQDSSSIDQNSNQNTNTVLDENPEVEVPKENIDQNPVVLPVQASSEVTVEQNPEI